MFGIIGPQKKRFDLAYQASQITFVLASRLPPAVVVPATDLAVKTPEEGRASHEWIGRKEFADAHEVKDLAVEPRHVLVDGNRVSVTPGMLREVKVGKAGPPHHLPGHLAHGFVEAASERTTIVDDPHIDIILVKSGADGANNEFRSGTVAQEDVENPCQVLPNENIEIVARLPQELSIDGRLVFGLGGT